MESISWSNDYSVKIPSIDEQHKKLLEYTNDLHKSILEDPEDVSILDVTFKRLYEYVDRHFSYEEKLLRTYGYPDYFQHKQGHADFLSQVREFEKQKKTNNIEPREVLFFLQNWLITHIKRTDKEYSDFLIAHNVK